MSKASNLHPFPSESLRDVAHRITDGSHFSPVPQTQGYLIANVKDMKSGYIDFDSCTRISLASYLELKATGCTIRNGSVLLSKDGTVGRVVVYHQDDEIGVLSSICIIEPSAHLMPSYLGHVLQSEGCTRQYDNFMSGSALRRLVLRDIRSIEIPLPTAVEQAVIANILDTLDTAIRETEAIIDKLKAVKQGLLHDLLTRGIDANGELRPPQSEAPHLYKQSPLGWVPNSWVFGVLADFLKGKPRNGYSPQEAGRWTGVQMLGLGCLTKEGFRSVQLKSAPVGDRQLNNALLSDGDLLISRANTRNLVGLVGIYRCVGTPCIYPDLMMRLTPSEDSSAEFLELILQFSRSRRQIQASAVGTSESMVKISSAIVSGLVVAIPSSAEQVEIIHRLDALLQKLKSEREVLDSMMAIKIGLMDDLLTGRVRVTPLLKSGGKL